MSTVGVVIPTLNKACNLPENARHDFEHLVRDPAAQAADVPVLEDVAFVRAVRRATSISRLPSPVVVSARRWETEGPYRTWLRNSALLIAYLLGVSPHRLAKWYPRQNA